MYILLLLSLVSSSSVEWWIKMVVALLVEHDPKNIENERLRLSLALTRIVYVSNIVDIFKRKENENGEKISAMRMLMIPLNLSCISLLKKYCQRMALLLWRKPSCVSSFSQWNCNTGSKMTTFFKPFLWEKREIIGIWLCHSLPGNKSASALRPE